MSFSDIPLPHGGGDVQRLLLHTEIAAGDACPLLSISPRVSQINDSHNHLTYREAKGFDDYLHGVAP